MKQSLLISLLMVSLTCSVAWAQTKKVSGTIKAEQGTGGFAGATVVVKGTTPRTVTDVNGTYTLNVPASGTTLVISAVGMQTIKKAISGRSVINAQLKTALLYEIIAQRYIFFLMQYEAFNDVRWLEKATPAIQLPIPLYTGTKKPERFIYPQNEIDTNSNVPNPLPDQFQKLPIY